MRLLLCFLCLFVAQTVLGQRGRIRFPRAFAMALIES